MTLTDIKSPPIFRRGSVWGTLRPGQRWVSVRLTPSRPAPEDVSTDISERSQVFG
jgi:hypothetical protein